MTTETKLAVKLELIVSELEKIAATSDSKDLAAALTLLPDLDKAVRKARSKWMAALVANAAQTSLPLQAKG